MARLPNPELEPRGAAPAPRQVWLLHWNASEADERAKQLFAAGYEVIRDASWNSAALTRLKRHPPCAVIIDLSRSPSKGRDLAAAIRSHAAMLAVPIVLVGGDANASASFGTIAVGTIHTTWERIESAIRHAIANPPRDLVRQSVFAAYTDTPLPKKLRIKANFTVALANAPEGFEQTLGELPTGVRLIRGARGGRDLTLWFPKSPAELSRRITTMGLNAAGGRLWIVWRKKSGAVPSDLSQKTVREAGLASGLVDFKICRIDETWSGLCFTRRK